MNYKQTSQDTTHAPTLAEVTRDLKAWNREHKPVDYGTKLPLFQYVINEPVEEGTGGSLIPLSKTTKLPAITLGDHAEGQLLARIQYPKGLMSRLPARHNLLAINYLIQNEQQSDALLRTIDGGYCRGLMTARFSPFDTLELIESIAPYCKRAKVRLVFDDPEVFHLSLTFPGTKARVKAGDVIERGIHVSNSEVGMRSVTIAGMVWRASCLNQLIGHSYGGNGHDRTGDSLENQGFKAGHKGRGESSGIVRIRHTGDSDRLRDQIGAAIESTYLESTKLLAQFKNSIKVRIDDPASRLMKVVEDNDLTQEDYKALLDSYMTEPDKNLFGVVNAISATARDREGEAQYQLQRIAGRELAGS